MNTGGNDGEPAIEVSADKMLLPLSQTPGPCTALGINCLGRPGAIFEQSQSVVGADNHQIVWKR
jgi:hypothetical protein